MTAINNIEKLIPLIKFGNPDTFYHIQILMRKKENKDVGSNSYLIKSYYINNEQYLRSKMPEIITLCNDFNARAYLNLSPRSFRKIAYHCQMKIASIMMNEDYMAVGKAYESVVAKYPDSKQGKLFLIDFDYADPTVGFTEEDSKKLKEIEDYVMQLQTEGKQLAIAVLVSTKNGEHIITKPFNVQKFKKRFPDIEVHKNNPTVLYMNK